MLDSEFHYFKIVYSVFYISPKPSPNFTPLNKRTNVQDRTLTHFRTYFSICMLVIEGLLTIILVSMCSLPAPIYFTPNSRSFWCKKRLCSFHRWPSLLTIPGSTRRRYYHKYWIYIVVLLHVFTTLLTGNMNAWLQRQPN